MTSKNSFTKLLRENTKRRLWAIALLWLAFFFLLLVSTALMISGYSSFLSMEPSEMEKLGLAFAQLKAEYLDSFVSFMSIANPALVCLIMVAAVICGSSGFSYLHSRQKTDFYHSLPVKRETLFSAVYVNGFLYVAVPYLVFLLFAGLFFQVRMGVAVPWGTLLMNYAMHMAFYLLLYSTVILAFVMTGNLVVGILGTGVFFLWGPGIIALKNLYFRTYFATFYDGIPDQWLPKSSPAAWYISSAVDTAGAGANALWALFTAAVLTALALFLYKKRPSEAAGHAMAFSWSRFPIKFLLVVPLALFGSYLFLEMKESDGWIVFGLICGLLISYAVIEIIYNFDFRRLFAHRVQLAACAVFAAAILAVFRFDLAGYDSYIPSQAKIGSAGVYCYVLDGDTLDAYQTEPELVENGARFYTRWGGMTAYELTGKMRLTDASPVLAVAAQGVADINQTRRTGTLLRGSAYRHQIARDAEDRDPQTVFDRVLVNYHLRNGKEVYREYYMNLTAVRDSLDQIYGAEEYKSAVYPLLALNEEEIAGINYQEQTDLRHVKLKDGEMKGKILSAYQEELSALTAETRRKESPVAAIQFKTQNMQKIIDAVRETEGDIGVFNRRAYYPIYPSFKKTIALLKECGISVGGYLTSDRIDSIELTDGYTGREDSGYGSVKIDTKAESGRVSYLTVTDQEQIREILAASVSRELNCTNRLRECVWDISITVKVRKDAGREEERMTEKDELIMEAEAAEEYRGGGMQETFDTYSLYFVAGEVPDFVKKAFQFDREREESYRLYGY